MRDPLVRGAAVPTWRSRAASAGAKSGRLRGSEIGPPPRGCGRRGWNRSASLADSAANGSRYAMHQLGGIPKDIYMYPSAGLRFTDVGVVLTWTEFKGGFWFLIDKQEVYMDRLFNGVVITPLDTHLMSAIIGLYFGGSLVKK